MKILFVQLPLVDHGLNYTAGNQQSASAALCGYIRKNFSGIIAEYLPSPAANLLSDDMITTWVVRKDPDILCMPTYLWNAERNLLIAAAVKKSMPSITVMFGGPEIQTDSFLMDETREDVDLFMCGEGEWFFREFLGNHDISAFVQTINGNRITIQSGDPVAIEDCPEPFTESMLESSVDGSVFVEMTRGCPYRCCYCNYSKNSPSVRERPFSILLSAVERAQSRKISGIYILAPSFGASGSFAQNLKELARVNRSVALHTEIRSDLITRETAHLMKEAGFESLEIGLQTLTATALEKIGRKGDPAHQIRGIKYLIDEGMDIKVGVIAGLPGDTIDEFTGTIDRLVDEGLSETIELYPLMILPGTKIRQMADEEKIAFQKKPPYFFLESPGFSRNDVLRIREYIEQATGFTASVQTLPDFCGSDKGFIRGIELDAAEKVFRLDPFVETNVFTIFLKNCTTDDLLRWIDEAYTIRQSSLIQIVAYNDITLFDEDKIRGALAGHEQDSFNARLHVYDNPRCAHRVFISHVTENADLFDMASGICFALTPILRVGSKIGAIRATDPSPAAVVIAAGTYHRMKKELGTYAEFTDLINFEDRTDMELFCRDNNLDCPEQSHTRIIRRSAV